MGNRSAIEGYLSELIGKPKIELEDRDKKFLIELLGSPGSVYTMTKIMNQKWEVRFPLDGDSKPQDNAASNTVFYITAGPMSRPAVRKRIRKLVSCGLIEEVNKKGLTVKERFAVNIHRAKPYRVTEYGLFYMLSRVVDYHPPSLFWRYWRSKVMRMLLSSYFEKKTFVRLTTAMYFTIAHFLIEACSITTRRLSSVEEAIKENDEAERQEQITRLEDDLLWHAKSFALRLIIDSASHKDDAYHRRRRLVLRDLAHDKKFHKLAETAVCEIVSYYKGGEFLR
jgi:hypothetical protein